MAMHAAVPNTTIVSVLAVATACWALVARAAESNDVWQAEPYRIHAQLAIDAPGDLADQLAEQLPNYLKARVNASIGIFWRLQTELASGPLRHHLIDNINSFTAADIADGPPDEDKRLLLSVRATPWGYELQAREFDRYVQRWGPTIRRTTRQREALPEQLFQLVEQAVSPLAQVRPDPQNPQQVVFDFRGSDLPPSSVDFSSSKPGEVFLPIVRVTTRAGTLVANGAAVVPWTYLEVIEPPDGTTPPIGKVVSATQRPLEVRHGRKALVAIGLRADPGDSTLRLQARTTPDKPLVGYEVYAQNIDEKPMRLVGLSDGAGKVTVTPGKSTIQMLYVKIDGTYLARLPIVPGAEDNIAVPLPDVDVQMRVAARLSAFREDMVDLVARRNIIMARVRQQIEDKDFAQARELLGSLDELPGPTQFGQTLDREAARHRTKDLQVQRRIDSLFSQTRTALGKFLDPRVIGELHEELQQAESPDKEIQSAEDKKTS
jgi:hypothetical protein